MRTRARVRVCMCICIDLMHVSAEYMCVYVYTWRLEVNSRADFLKKKKSCALSAPRTQEPACLYVLALEL